MMSNKGLNSKEALDDSTATNSSVTLSGIRREKEAPTDLDITDYSRNPGKRDPPLPRLQRGRPGQRVARLRSGPDRHSGGVCAAGAKISDGQSALCCVAQERLEIECVRGHPDGTVGVPRPLIFRTIPIKL